MYIKTECRPSLYFTENNDFEISIEVINSTERYEERRILVDNMYLDKSLLRRIIETMTTNLQDMIIKEYSVKSRLTGKERE